jgi:hypothetical protein
MSYEDQLYVWSLLLRNKLAGKIAPAHPWDRRPTENALLVPDSFAVAAVNAISDTPITVKHLPPILARFKHLDPPYRSFPVARPASAARKAYRRDWMAKHRACEPKNEGVRY